MKFQARGQQGRCFFAAAVILLLVMCGCKIDSASKSEDKPAEPANAASADSGSGPGIDLNCVFDWMQKPSEPFHYSYKKSGENFVEESADVTPQTFDGTFKNRNASNSVHGVRSDEDGWRMAWGSLMGIAGMSSTVALVNHSSAMVRESTEKMNGYDTIRYSIDTSRANSAEAGLYKSTLGQGGFEKGAAWVTDKGCPIKISLDSESHSNDGSVDKVHYEEEIVKKP